VRTEVALDVRFDPLTLALEDRRDADALAAADYGAVLKEALRSAFPEVRERAYASAAVLTLIILLVSLAGRAMSRKATRHIVK
jgi:ABC-type phosphate transport system permease subunit